MASGTYLTGETPGELQHRKNGTIVKKRSILTRLLLCVYPPYGTTEGVAIGTSRLPGAGRGLFGIKPSPHNPLLFKLAHELVCVYATMKDLIPMEEAQVSDSPYIWTNSKNLQLDWDPEAL